MTAPAAEIDLGVGLSIRDAPRPVELEADERVVVGVHVNRVTDHAVSRFDERGAAGEFVGDGGA
ncbi:MAG: hypothetical protein ACLP01_05510 [Solirubrobacteraceae bacterium]